MYRHRAISYESSFGEILRYLLALDHGLSREQIHRVLEVLRRSFDRGAYEAKSIDSLKTQLLTAVSAVEEIGLHSTSLLAILLWRPLSCGVVTEEQIEQSFGADTAHLDRLLLRVCEVYDPTEVMTSDNLGRFLLSFAEDVRIILILIADRLVRLRLAGHLLGEEEQRVLSDEVHTIFAPYAHRMGLYAVKSEMDDLALKYTDRKAYTYIKEKLAQTKDARDAYIAAFIEPVEKRLREAGLRFHIKGRTKSISSIHHKLQVQKCAFEQIYDLFAIRIILDSEPKEEKGDCWHVYSIVTDMYQPNPKRLKDWISIPKSNGYQSLHITVMGPDHRWVEVQIRTERMDEIAERGLAAHWRYKGIKSETGLDDLMTEARRILEMGDKLPEDEVIKDFRMDLYDEEVYVFTPKGEVLQLPKGATVLDFAFSIHTNVGSHCVSARVNGSNVGLRYVLQNGDSVSVITSDSQAPKADWLDIAQTSRAKNKIRSYLRNKDEERVALAREDLERKIRNRKLEWDEGEFARLMKRHGYKGESDFLLAVADGRYEVNQVLDDYKALLEERTESAKESRPKVSAEDYERETELEQLSTADKDVILIDGKLTGIDYELAQCCHPIYGDRIFAYASRTGMRIHSYDCPNATDLFTRYSYRIHRAEWAGIAADRAAREVTLRVVGEDDIAVVNNISTRIGLEKGVKLKNFRIESNDGLFLGFFTLYADDERSLKQLVRLIRQAKGVKSVDRIE